MRLATCIVLVCFMITPQLGKAHEIGASTSIVVETFDSKTDLLLTWTAPTGVMTQMMLALSSWGQSTPLKLRRSLGRRALSTLHTKLNGIPIDPNDFSVKVVFEKSRPSRYAVVAFTSLKSNKNNTLEIAPAGQESARILWVDKTAKTRVTTHLSPNAWQRLRHINFTWKH